MQEIRNSNLLWSPEVVIQIISSTTSSQIGFTFATLQASGKTPQNIDKLQTSDIGLDKISAPSGKKRPESLCMPANFKVSIF